MKERKRGRGLENGPVAPAPGETLMDRLEQTLERARRDLETLRGRVQDVALYRELECLDGALVRSLQAAGVARAMEPAESGAPGADLRASSLAAPAEPERVRVLLVDDHELVREGLVGLLAEEPDIEVVGEASGGNIALEMVRRLQPDVVVMDVSMPDMNGIEATRRITTERPGVHVIGLSMHQEEDMAAAMREFGADAYLTKDGSSEALLDAIRRCRRGDGNGR